MRMIVCVAPIALLLSCSSDTDQPPATVTTTGRAMAQLLDDGKGLEHVARINDNLYRGAQPTEEGYRTLKEMGIKTVICLRYYTSNKKKVEAAGLRYVELRIHADIGSTPPTDEQVKLFFDTVLDPEKQPVYFHCKHGKDRTGTMAAIYRIERDGWTNKEAEEELQAFGYHDIFKDLVAFVREYKPRGFKPRR
ncbi:MAG: protein tyrosine phosphatase family protein [Planctomycetota bacterium]